MTTILKAMVLPAALTAGLGLAQPVQAATAVVQRYPVITQLGNAQKSVTEVRWRGGWGHGGYWRHGGWGHRGWGWQRGWGWRRGWGYRPWGWGYRHYGWGYPGYPGYGCGGYGCYYSRPVVFFGVPWAFRF
jgi:hypothetical protein